MFPGIVRTPRITARQAQRGIALIAVLLTLLIVTMLGLAVNTLGTLDLAIGTNERHAAEVLYIAEAGITHARSLILGQSMGFNAEAGITQAPSLNLGQLMGFDASLQGGNGTACDGDELSSTPRPPFSAADAIPGAGMTVLPGGSYRVFVCDDHSVEISLSPPNTDPNVDANGTVLVRSVGTGRNGATATLEVTFMQVPLPGLLVDGNLRINGNPELTGPGGAVHANGELELPGNPCAAEYFSSATTVTGDAQTGDCPSGSDNPTDLRPGQSPIAIPPIRPADYRSAADYILGNDGQVYNPAGAQIGTPGSGAFNDWSWDPGNRRWVAGNDIPAGTYYADDTPNGTPNTPAAATSIEIWGNPQGPGGAAIALTLIATGWINVSGNPKMRPDLSVGAQSISMLAGTDLSISGNPSIIHQGLHFAGHQISFSGNPVINGQVIADNEADFGVPENLVEWKSGKFMEVSGNATINSIGGLTTTKMAAWRECRGSNPADPCL